MRQLLLFALLLLLAGCFEPTKEPENSVVDPELTQELAHIDSTKEVELKKLEQRVELEQLQSDLLLKQQSINEEYLYKKERNLILLSAFLILILALGVYMLIKHRRENRQKAYDNNLKKYFHQQEIQSRMRLAEKIIDKIQDSTHPTEQDKKLIEILHSVSTPVENEITNSNNQIAKK